MSTVVQPLSGWGRGGRRLARVLQPRADGDLARDLPELVECGGPVTVRGAGESYGDAALPPDDGGCVLDMSGRDGLVSFDVERGVVVAQSGLSLRRLESIVSGGGWTVPVLPGSGAVTVGGAVASDVHGKNEPGAGTFGAHVSWLTLLHPGGTGRRLAPDRDGDAFWATVGGMGLTGVIDLVSLRLARAPVRQMTRRRVRTATLAQSLALLDDLADQQRREPQLHVVAWLDAASPGSAGRCVVEVCRPADVQTRRPRRSLDTGRTRRHAALPGPGLVGRATIRAADEVRWRLAGGEATRDVDLDQALWPMQQVAWWPAAFGRQGLIQYQLVLPDNAADELATVLQLVHRHRVPPALAVLKRFTGTSPALLGFERPGWSLALDFPRRWTALGAALHAVDDLVTSHGGRVYLTKDSRLPGGLLEAMYPRLPEWRSVRDRLDPCQCMTSSLGVRLGLVPAA
jgi:decaprenylphospho-beta-D-ribofuranose 2-oxidase